MEPWKEALPARKDETPMQPVVEAVGVKGWLWVLLMTCRQLCWAGWVILLLTGRLPQVQVVVFILALGFTIAVKLNEGKPDPPQE